MTSPAPPHPSQLQPRTFPLLARHQQLPQRLPPPGPSPIQEHYQGIEIGEFNLFRKILLFSQLLDIYIHSFSQFFHCGKSGFTVRFSMRASPGWDIPARSANSC